MVTPNARAITSATRGAVHRSVENPNSHGLRPSHAATSAARASDSFGGRPGWGTAASPRSPPSRSAALHRRTDRSVARTASATSAGSIP
jgi:hypothetical protein